MCQYHAHFNTHTHSCKHIDNKRPKQSSIQSYDLDLSHGRRNLFSVANVVAIVAAAICCKFTFIYFYVNERASMHDDDKDETLRVLSFLWATTRNAKIFQQNRKLLK